jgi:hypothetical protein
LATGLNGAMYDGSVRWVSVDEAERLAVELGNPTWTVNRPRTLLGNTAWNGGSASDNGGHRTRFQILAHRNLTLTGR